MKHKPLILASLLSKLNVERWKLDVLLLAALGSLLHPTASIGEEGQPRLIIDPRGPSGLVRELLFTPDGGTMISLGEDKEIRFWDVETGDLRKTLRLEIGDGKEGAIFAGAISPDGRWLALGGFFDVDAMSGKESLKKGDIRLVDLESDRIVTVLRGHRNSILALAFSDDGRWLASGSGDDTVRVWDVGGEGEKIRIGAAEPVMVSESQELTAHSAFVLAVDFAPGGERLVSGAFDHKLILWERDGTSGYRRKATLEKHTAEVFSVSYSPDGRHIVSGGYDHKLLLWDGGDGGFLRALEDEMDYHVRTVTFSRDGGRVLASSAPVGYTAIFNLAGGERVTISREHDNSVMASAWHPTKNLVASAGGDDGDIYLWRPNSGELVHHLRGDGRAGKAVAFAKEGELNVAFGQTSEGEGLLGKHLQRTFDFTTFTLEDLPATQTDPPGFRRTVTARSGKVLKKTDSNHLQTGSGEIANDPNIERSIRSYSFTPAGDIVVGSTTSLKLLSPTGETLRKFTGHEGAVWAVSPSPDGRYLASASDDQTIRLWNLQTGELLANLFVARDGEWVCWTPEGYYAASPEGGKYIGWHFNRGIDKIAGYLSGDQLYEHFYRPDIVKRVVEENRPSSEIVAELGLKFDLQEALRGAPGVEIASPAPSYFSPNRRLRVEVAGVDNGGGVAEVRLFNADKRISPDGPGSFQSGKWIVPFTVSLAPGENRLRAVSVNPKGTESLPEEITVRYEGETASSRLHIVAVGLNNYQNPRLALDYCRPDVEAFVETFISGAAPLVSGDPIVHRLFDSEATGPAIEAKLQQVAGEAAPEDIFVFAFAGHGVMSEGTDGKAPEFHLIPYEVTQLYGRDDGLAVAISASRLEELAAAIPAKKQLMLLDACQSGGIVETFAMRGVAEQKAIAQLSRATGMHILASTRTEQFATEAAVLGHGLFTYAVLEGLRGGGDSNGDQRVTVKELEVFLNTRVPELSEEHIGTAQYPNSFGRGQDFPLGIVR